MAKSKSYMAAYWAATGISVYMSGGLSTGSGSTDVTSRYADMTLAQAEDALRAIGDHEEAVVFDKNMNVIAAYSGGDSSVSLPDSLKNRRDITITHNHPGGDAGYGGVLSPSDVGWFATSKAAEIRAVASGQGEFVYSLQVRSSQSAMSTQYAKTQLNLWAHMMKRDTLPPSKGGTGKLQSDYRRAYNQHMRNGATKAAARHAAWQQATGAIERSLSDKVAELSGSGAIYYARNRYYNVGR